MNFHFRDAVKTCPGECCNFFFGQWKSLFAEDVPRRVSFMKFSLSRFRVSADKSRRIFGLMFNG